jgi:chaperonin GroES
MIQPLPGYVLIRPIEDDGKTSGGLYLPDSSKDKPMKGKIVATSDVIFFQGEIMPIGGMTLAKGYADLKIGMIVAYKKWTNQEITHEGEEYLIVNYNELLAIIE